jgi:hypothetical protein
MSSAAKDGRTLASLWSQLIKTSFGKRSILTFPIAMAKNRDEVGAILLRFSTLNNLYDLIESNRIDMNFSWESKKELIKLGFDEPLIEKISPKKDLLIICHIENSDIYSSVAITNLLQDNNESQTLIHCSECGKICEYGWMKDCHFCHTILYCSRKCMRKDYWKHRNSKECIKCLCKEY